MSYESLNVTAAQRGAELIESLSLPDALQQSLTESQRCDLEALLQAIEVRDDLTDAQYDDLFQSMHEEDVGFDACKLLVHHKTDNALAFVLRFFEWLASIRATAALLDRGPALIECCEPETAESLLKYMLDPDNHVDVRMSLIDGVKNLGEKHPQVKQLAIPFILEGLNRAQEYSVRFNSCFMMLAIDWRVTEAAEPLERAFSANLIDCGMAGNWEVVRKLLHVESLGLPMPKQPYNSIEDFRRNVGVGAFSDKPLFFSGEMEDDACQQYLENACLAFAQSKQGKALLTEGHYPHDLHQFLDLALSYLGVNVENMTPPEAEELLLDIYPRKVSLTQTDTGEIIEELVAFWQFCHRVHDMEHAKAIAHRIAKLKRPFHQNMNDSSKHGMAKSFFMAGTEAGYDMTTTEGLNEFMQVYNSSLAATQTLPSQPRSPALSLKKRKKMLAKKLKNKKK